MTCGAESYELLLNYGITGSGPDAGESYTMGFLN